jgi:uncharacterized protein YebE (UPF0316 family)
MTNIMGTIWFDYFVVPLLILIARVMDVSLDTIRVIMIAKGYRRLAPFIGFFQVLIWIITISRIMANLENWTTYIGYAGGFALGTYVGMKIEERLALGYELIRVVTRADASSLIQELIEKGYHITFIDGKGRDGKVGILFIVHKRKVIREIIGLIKKFNPNAFYTVEDVRFVSGAEYLPRSSRLYRTRFRPR